MLNDVLHIGAIPSSSSSSPRTITESDCRLEEERVAYTTIELELSNMPINSRKAYISKIHEFINLCKSRNDSFTVTPHKVANFLQKEIIDRNIKKGDKWNGVKVGKSTIEHYVNALTKLHSFQVHTFFLFMKIFVF